MGSCSRENSTKMKCVSVVLLFCAIWSVDSGSNQITIVNVLTGLLRVGIVDKNLSLSEARNFLNIDSSDIFYIHTVEDINTQEKYQNAAIDKSVETNLTIDSIIYRDSYIYVGSSEPDIDVIHIDDERRPRRLKMTSTWPDKTLAEFRTILGSIGFRLDDIFYVKMDNTYSAVFNESAHTLRQILRDGKVYVGPAPGDISRFLTGVKLDTNGNLVACNFKVADLKKFVTPSDVLHSGFQSSFTSNFQELKAMESGITDMSFSASGGAFGIFSFSASYGQTDSHEKSNSGQTYTSYNFATYVIEKQEIEMAQDDLQISNTFYTDLRSALLPGQEQIHKAKNVLNVLQKYGWYVPIHFKTGGAFREYKSSQVSSYDEAVKESNKFSAEFKAGLTFSFVNGEVGAKYGKETHSQNESHRKTENKANVRSSVGGDGTAFNIEAFGTSLSDAKKWRIIEYKRLFPTLMLLQTYDSGSLSQILTLLSDYSTALQDIEKGVDIKKYLLNLQLLIGGW